ncbi:MAG: hypothetical protein FJ145_12510 [Deltaproteobacteria bacterium]|nr:hypothetical protein [Deltaproteobacteria bacterium]
MASPVRIYAGTQEGLFVWRAQSGGWETVNVAFKTGTIDGIDGLRRKPNVVFLCVTQDGLYRTDDAGKSWRRVFEGNVRTVTVDPTNEEVIYCGVEPIHLYRSEDGGKSWEELTGVQALPAEVKKNWSYPRPPHREHVRHVFVHPDDPNILHVCLEHGGIIRSFDRGTTWQDVSRGIDYLDIHHLSSAPGRKDLFFVATARGFFKSTDPSNGWQRAENGFTRDYFHDFVFLPGNPGAMLVATADKSPGYWDRPERAQGAVFRSRNQAESWERVGVGQWLPNDMKQMVWALAQHPEDPSIVYAGLGAVSRGRSADASQKGEGDILVSEDQGDSWERLPLDLPADRVLWIAAE